MSRRSQERAEAQPRRRVRASAQPLRADTKSTTGSSSASGRARALAELATLGSAVTVHIDELPPSFIDDFKIGLSD